MVEESFIGSAGCIWSCKGLAGFEVGEAMIATSRLAFGGLAGAFLGAGFCLNRKMHGW